MKNNIITIIGEEYIKQIDCNTCEYVFGNGKCKVIKMNPKPPTNEMVWNLISTGILGEFGNSACEYFEFKDKKIKQEIEQRIKNGGDRIT
jgi:hypothetical protein